MQTHRENNLATKNNPHKQHEKPIPGVHTSSLHNQNNHPHPHKRRGGGYQNLGVDFKHAVEFSKNGHFTSQPHHRATPGVSLSVFPTLPELLSGPIFRSCRNSGHGRPPGGRSPGYPLRWSRKRTGAERPVANRGAPPGVGVRPRRPQGGSSGGAGRCRRPTCPRCDGPVAGVGASRRCRPGPTWPRLLRSSA